MTVLALSLALAAGCQKDDPAQPNPWKIEAKLSLDQAGGDWVFVVEGSTNLPSNALLRARVYAVERVNGPRGVREDEEPLVWEDDPEALNPGYRTFEVGEGKFRVEVYKFPRKPWSIHYRGRIHFQQNLQPRDVLAKVTVDDFSGHSDLKLSNKQAFAAEYKERSEEACKDIETIHGLFVDLKKQFADQQKDFREPAWAAWKGKWLDQIEEIAGRNKERYGLWAVWVERQAKMRVGGMCDILRGTLTLCTDSLKGDKEALERAQKRFEGFHAYYEEALEIICPNAPLDATLIAPLVETYEKGFLPVRAWVERGEGEWPAARRSARTVCSEALFKIPLLVKTRKTAYTFVSDISDRFTRLLELADGTADPKELKKALAEHDRAVADFKKLAGLK